MRKSNHEHALENAEPSAHYLEYISGKANKANKKAKKEKEK